VLIGRDGGLVFMTEIELTDWYLIRHAPVASDHPGLYQDQDAPIAPLETERLARLATMLPTDADWHVSPRTRTQQTAQALQSHLPGCTAPRTDKRLAEQSYGDWHGLSFGDLWPLIEDLPAHNWSILAAATTPPNGDNFMAVWDQAADFMKEFEPASTRPQIVVAHAGTIRAIIGHILGLSPDMALSLSIDTLSLTHLRHQTNTGLGGAWQLAYLNRETSP
jgi:alpha-ribazole phosphatase